jgi:hypothetical protein
MRRADPRGTTDGGAQISAGERMGLCGMTATGSPLCVVAATL